jgi:hypothetical protein
VGLARAAAEGGDVDLVAGGHGHEGHGLILGCGRQEGLQGRHWFSLTIALTL